MSSAAPASREGVSVRESGSSRSAFVPHDVTAPIVGRTGGPLDGLTVAVKDMYDIAGCRTGGGNPDWLEAQRPAAAHAGAVTKLLRAGATVVGKTVCDELLYSVTGANAHYGTPINPRSPGRLPGGSSSGSAVACAAGACDLAIGSDTAGSMRVPGALCGVYGIRTTRGRFDMSGAMRMAPSFDAGGWFSAVPGVFRRAGQVLLEGTPVPAEPRRLVLLEDAFEVADPEVAAVAGRAVDEASSRLSTPVRVRAGTGPGDDLEAWRESMRVVQAYEAWQSFGEFVTSRRPVLGPGVRERMAAARGTTSNEAVAERVVLARAQRRMDAVVPPGTVAVLPTAPSVAPWADASAQELESFRVRSMRLSCLASISGLPQVTMPVGTVDGVPVGLSLLGWRGGDETLLSLAMTLARVLAGGV